MRAIQIRIADGGLAEEETVVLLGKQHLPKVRKPKGDFESNRLSKQDLHDLNRALDAGMAQSKRRSTHYA